MNIQQALNQSLLSVAGSAYLRNQILEQGKQSAITNYQAASKAQMDAEKQRSIDVAVARDEYEEKYGNKDEEFIDKQVAGNAKVIQAGKLEDIADRNLKRAERKLERWDTNRDEVDDYKMMHDAGRSKMLEDLFIDMPVIKAEARELRKSRQDDMWDNLFPDAPAAKAEAKALRSLSNKTKTYASQEKAKQNRPEILKLGLNKSIRQPSISKEE